MAYTGDFPIKDELQLARKGEVVSALQMRTIYQTSYIISLMGCKHTIGRHCHCSGFS